jgi:hypothetical protein
MTSVIKTMMSHKHSTPDRFEQYLWNHTTALEGYRAHLDFIVETLLREEDEKDILFLKDPGILEAFDGYWELFPESEFVAILRNPIEVLASRHAVAARAGRDFDWEQEIERVRKDTRRLVGIVNRCSGPRLLLVGYDDLTADLPGVIERIERKLVTEISPELERRPGPSDSPFATERSEMSMVRSSNSTLDLLPTQTRSEAEDALADEIRLCERVVANHR